MQSSLWHDLWVKGKVVLVLNEAVRDCGNTTVPFFTSTGDGDEWSASRPVRFTPGGSRPRYPFSRRPNGLQSLSERTGDRPHAKHLPTHNEKENEYACMASNLRHWLGWWNLPLQYVWFYRSSRRKGTTVFISKTHGTRIHFPSTRAPHRHLCHCEFLLMFVFLQGSRELGSSDWKLLTSLPITVAERSKAWSLFARSNTGIMCSVFVFPCVGSGLPIRWSPSMESYRRYKLRDWSETKRFPDILCSRRWNKKYEWMAGWMNDGVNEWMSDTANEWFID
jgi:hypothetical protein